ncbi:MAG TPA: hypothetical protein VHO69_07310 [Phototrophicaceae bacterium]|nr:hypothetical protein [Phototrophicaceae bacterium]
MPKTIVALYEDFDVAQDVVEDLVEAGLSRENISLVANDAAGDYARNLGTTTSIYQTDDVTGGEGAGFGAVVGGLIGLGAMLIPGIGPVIAAGPLVAGLTGAAVGAVAGAATGGIVASLVKLGVIEEEAEYYAEGVRRGGSLVTAQVDDTWEQRTVDIMSRHRPVDIRHSAEDWRRSGWTGFDATSTDYTTREREPLGVSSREASAREMSTNPTWAAGTVSGDYTSYNDEFHTHYTNTYASLGQTYDYYNPAYRYGYLLATDNRYNSYRDWSDVEIYARRGWEESNEGTWENFKDAVQYAWKRVRNAVS